MMMLLPAGHCVHSELHHLVQDACWLGGAVQAHNIAFRFRSVPYLSPVPYVRVDQVVWSPDVTLFISLWATELRQGTA
jgi:hypothetical protein